MADAQKKTIRERLRIIIFEADTTAGKAFDLLLIIAIMISVLAAILESVDSIHQDYGRILITAEWVFTVLFTIEYIARLWCVDAPLRYARSLFGVVDLLAILPTYLSLILPGSEYLLVIRLVRVLRLFRILKLLHYIDSANVIRRALLASRHKITVFIMCIVVMITIFGALMYLVEGPENGFTSIPKSMYWAVVTLTTVGYGDISPQTPLGQFLASIVMLMGYAIIAVPTGIVSAEMARATVVPRTNTRACRNCGAEGHADDAIHCRICGTVLNAPDDSTAA